MAVLFKRNKLVVVSTFVAAALLTNVQAVHKNSSCGDEDQKGKQEKPPKDEDEFTDSPDGNSEDEGRYMNFAVEAPSVGSKAKCASGTASHPKCKAWRIRGGNQLVGSKCYTKKKGSKKTFYVCMPAKDAHSTSKATTMFRERVPCGCRNEFDLEDSAPDEK
ncbi:unnamed protein product [Amoebophrya sp. A25]|nr:unnamed protein product [Amoebophrya sp. A25]|eukprot:GSA25T00007989001.1